MRARFSLVIGLGVALGLASPGMADPVDYTDAAGNGNWSDPAAWDQNSAYPGGNDPADTATIDSGTMTVDTDVPLMGLIAVNGGGKIYAYLNLTQDNNVVINSGGVVEFRAEYQAANQYKYDWNVTLNDGATFYANMHNNGGMRGDITIGDAATVTIKHNGAQYYNAKFSGTWTGPNTSTVNLTRNSSVEYMTIYANCNALKSAINVNSPVIVRNTGGFGDNTGSPGAVMVNAGGVLSFERQYNDTGNGVWARDVVVNGGTLRQVVHQSFSITWSGSVLLQSNTTWSMACSTQYDHGWTYITGQITEDATPRSLHLSYSGTSSAYVQKEVTLDNPANDFSGGLKMTHGDTYIRQDGAQGLGGIELVGGDADLILDDNDGPTDWTWTNNLSGSGKIKVEDGSGTYVLTANGSTVSPGNSTGTLTIDGGFAFANNATLVAEITGALEGDPPTLVFYNDLLAVQHDLNGLSNADLLVVVDSSLTPADLAGEEFTIVTAANDLSAMQFNSVTFQDDTGAPLAGAVTYGNGFVTVAVPEPATVALLGLGLLPLLRRRRRG